MLSDSTDVLNYRLYCDSASSSVDETACLAENLAAGDNLDETYRRADRGTPLHDRCGMREPLAG